MTRTLAILAALGAAAVVGYVEEMRISGLKADLEMAVADKTVAESRASALAEAMKARRELDAEAVEDAREMEKILAGHCDWAAIPVPDDVCERLRGKAYRR